MSKKKKPDERGFVFSTDPNFQFEHHNENQETLPPHQQRLKIRLETKQRAGKAVTTIEGFEGRKEDMLELGKKLKTFCGTGGSVDEGVILVQGDQRDKVMQFLVKSGYKLAKKV